MSTGIVELAPQGGVDVGGDLGDVIGTWGGRVIGGAIGELFGPEAVPIGAYAGGKIGGFAGRAAGTYIASQMAAHNDRAGDRLRKKAISRTCTSCKDCNDLQNEIDETRDEVSERKQALREDQWNLYQYRPNKRPGYEDKGTWPGHLQQLNEKKKRLRDLLDDANTADCQPNEKDSRKLSTEDSPTQPAPKPPDYVEPDPRGINGKTS